VYVALPTNTQNTFKLSPGRSWNTLHSQSDRLYASDNKNSSGDERANVNFLRRTYTGDILYHILITANMQSKTAFPSSHQLKSYVAPKSRLKFAARCPVSGCWPSCWRSASSRSLLVWRSYIMITAHSELHAGLSFWRCLWLFGRPFVKRFALCYQTVRLCLSCLSVLPVTVYCGQTVGWIKMKLGMQVGLGLATLC